MDIHVTERAVNANVVLTNAPPMQDQESVRIEGDGMYHGETVGSRPFR
jgi:hypothetical protein